VWGVGGRWWAVCGRVCGEEWKGKRGSACLKKEARTGSRLKYSTCSVNGELCQRCLLLALRAEQAESCQR